MSMVETAKPVGAHTWEREANEHYVEPHWCSERLFEVEQFTGPIWDPCCGFGRIPEAAKRAGIPAIGTDLMDRGWRDIAGTFDFTTSGPMIDTGEFDIVCNPPFNIAGRFAQHALDMKGVRKVAMIFPTARLNAAHWLRGTRLARVWLMTPRPSMPPGHVIAAGEKPGGGKMDFCWLVWANHYPPGDGAVMKWLRRNP